MFDVTALGELLIDLANKGISENGSVIYEANPGGAPCNVLAMVNKLGGTAAFIGKVGADAFGDKLRETVYKLGINCEGLVTDNTVNTTLAIVSTDESGDRSFSFYREPGADMMLTADEVNEAIIADSRIFHFGTISMTHSGVEEATKKAVDAAKKAGCIISFDPNLRKPLWKNMEDARKKMIYGFSKCDILKIEEDELEFVTGAKGNIGIKALIKEYGIKLILLTAGTKGCTAYYKNMEISQQAYLQNETIDTTGAGDTFFGTCLYTLKNLDINNLSENDIAQMLKKASAAASIITTRKGALSVMPDENEIEEFLKNRD